MNQAKALPRISEYITANEVNLCLSIQTFQESLHSQSYSYMLDTICSPEERNEILYQWKDDKHLLDRNTLIGNIYNEFTTSSDKKTFLKVLMANYILEGIYFYSGFMFFYNLSRNGKMPGSAQEIRYINRDENTHLWLFRNIIIELQKEEPELFTDENINMIKDLLKQGVEQEIEWGKYVIGDNIPGLSSKMVEDYILYLGNLRWSGLGYGTLYEGHNEDCTERKNDMSKKHFWKRGIAAACAVVTAATGLALPVFAADASSLAVTPKVVALGDDCLAEVSGSESAVSYMADYLGGNAVNYAAVGTTSGKLVSDLQSDQNMKRDVQTADVVMISVGVNDFIEEVLYKNADLVDMDSCKTLTDVANKLTSDSSKLSAANSKLAQDLPALVETVAANIEAAVTEVKSLNRSADVVVQTVNNPLGVDYYGMSGVSQNRKTVIAYLYQYLDVSLEGGNVSGTGLASMTIADNAGLNDKIRGLQNASAADFYTPYVGAVGEKAIGFEFSNIMDLNMTFTPLGQVMLASAAIQSSEMLSCGDGSVISNAYTATGKDGDLKSNRPSADSIITGAASHQKMACSMGDADASGSIDTQDLFLCLYNIARVGAGLDTELNPIQRKALDADNSGTLDSQDIFLWLYYMAQTGAGVHVDLADYLAQNQA